MFFLLIRTRNATSFLLPLCVLPAFLETVRILLLFFNKGILSPYSARRIDRNITSKCPLLNYLLLIAKVYFWDCRRSETVRAHFGQSNFSFFQQKRKKEILLILIIFTYFKVRTKIEKKKMVRKIDHFFIFSFF